MMALYTETDILAVLPRLTQTRLLGFIEARIIMPQQSETGYAFRPVDIARLELLCDLADDLDLDETALLVVISLLDQLHAARQDIHRLAKALQDEDADIRQRIGRALT